MLYGRRVIDSCLAILFAEQSTLSLNRSIAFVLCMTIQVNMQSQWIPSQSSSSFYWVYMILEGLINIVITRHNIDLSCPGTDTMFIQFNLERYP